MGYLTPVRSYLADDFAMIPFTDAETSYLIGTMAFAADPSGLPELASNPDTGQPGFTAHEILLYATQDCYVRFNGSSRVQHRLFANTYYRFRRRTHTIYVQRVAADGILYLWAEG